MRVADPRKTRPPRRAAQYVRASTDHQRYSIPNQISGIAEYASLHGIEVVKSYSDYGKSGVSLTGRFGLQALIRDVVSSPDFSAVLVYDVSRWGRFQDIDESAYYEFLCRRSGVDILYCAENFGMAGSIASDIMKVVKRAMAGEYSRELSRRVFDGQCRLARMGYKQGGVAPYGMRRLVVNDAGETLNILRAGERKGPVASHIAHGLGGARELELVRFVFRLFVDHELPIRHIVTILRVSLRRRALQKEWNRYAVLSILRNEVYLGSTVFNRTASKLGTIVSNNPRELWIRVVATHPEVIDEDRFLKAANRIIVLENRTALVRNRRTLKELLTLSHDLNAEVCSFLGGAGRDRLRRFISEADHLKAEAGRSLRIYRLVTGDTGWGFRIRLKGVSRRKVFSDAIHGGQDNAREAALLALEKDGDLILEFNRLRNQVVGRSTNTSGCTGVTFVNDHGRSAAHWHAFWPIANGKRGSKRFRIREYGHEVSKELALHARAEGISAAMARYSLLEDYLARRGYFSAEPYLTLTDDLFAP